MTIATAIRDFRRDDGIGTQTTERADVCKWARADRLLSGIAPLDRDVRSGQEKRTSHGGCATPRHQHLVQSGGPDMNGRMIKGRSASVIGGVVALLGGATQNAASSAPVQANYRDGGCQPRSLVWQVQGSQFGHLLWFHGLEASPKRLRWNGSPVSGKALIGRLKKASINPYGGVVLILDPALSCDKVAAFRHVVEQEMKCGPARICVEYSTQEWQAAEPPVPSMNVR